MTVHDGIPADLTTFVGREALLATTTGLLTQGKTRLVTLIGIGGVGKTRVALAAARSTAHRYAHGVALVDLTDVRPGDGRVETAVIEALGIADNTAVASGRERLAAYLRDLALLLVIDNCEHLLDDGELPGLVSWLLRTAPAMQIIATSRSPLGVPGEQRLPVPPMLVDQDGGDQPEAMTLLLDRAAMCGTPIEPSDYPVALELCQELDGIPLAIELAAGRLDTMTLHEIVDRSEDALRDLVHGPLSGQRHSADFSHPPHHHTLRATLGWSYDLLADRERRTWVLLSVFDSWFDRNAAEGVAERAGGQAAEVFDSMRLLVRASVLTTTQSRGRTYYRMLSMVSAFGREKAGAEMDRVRDAHADYFASVVDQAADDWFGARESTWIARIRQCLHDIRAAVDHHLDHGRWEPALSIACQLNRTRTLMAVGQVNEGRRLLRKCLDAHPPEPSELQVTALAMLAHMAAPTIAHPLLDQARAAAQRLGPAAQANVALMVADTMNGWVSAPDADTHTQLSALSTAYDLLVDQPGERAMVAIMAAVAASFVADEATARKLVARAWTDVDGSGADIALSWCLYARALVELRFGEPPEALLLLQRGLRLQHDGEDTAGPGMGLWLRAVAALRMGQTMLAAQMFATAEAHLDGTEVEIRAIRPWWRLREQVHAELGAGSSTPDLSLALTFDEAVELALRPAEKSAEQRDLGITARQLAVAELVALGLTNQQIATRLGISARTVEVHISAIIGRLELGTRSRVGVANWYRDNVAVSGTGPPRP